MTPTAPMNATETQTPARPLTRRRWIRRIAIALAIFLPTLLLALFCFELWARSYQSDVWRYLRKDDQLGWSLTPNARSFSMIPNDKGWFYKQKIRINSQGLRDDRDLPYEKPPATKRILILGDSFVECAQVPIEHTFMMKLQDELLSGGHTHLQVIAYGVSAYGTDQEYLYYKVEGRKYKPDFVDVIFFPMNDFADCDPELKTHAHHEKYYFQIEDGQLVAETTPRFPTPQIEIMKQANHPFLSRFGSYHFMKAWVGAYSYGTAGLFNKLGIMEPLSLKDKDGYWMEHTILRTPLTPEYERAVQRCEAILKEMKREVESDGGKLRGIIMPFAEVLKACYPDQARNLFPPAELIDLRQPERLAAEMFARLDIPHLDLTDDLLKTIRELGKPTHYRIDRHLNALGHETVARAIFQFHAQLGDLKAEP